MASAPRDFETRPRPTTADYLVAAISPALIMTLVGSLVFFLLEVFYQGGHGARLQFIFGLFVFAAVLIARISMEEGRAYAMYFAAPLGILTAIAMWRFVEIRGPLANLSLLVNVGLLALVWWATDKLTRDCTLVDQSQDASAQGLMQSIGFEAAGRTESLTLATEPTAGAAEGGWWSRLKQRRKQTRANGVWVVYFSLAALPLFGIGEKFVSADATGSRGYVFLLLCVYLASGFGLLITTSLLGLRRYLRGRRVQMSNEMMGTWLSLGGLLIVGLMVAVFLLPRGISDLSPSQLPLEFGSPDDRETSKYAPGDDGERDDNANRTSDNADGTSAGATDQNPHDAKSPSNDNNAKSGGSKGSDEHSKDGSPNNQSNSDGSPRDHKMAGDDSKSGTDKSEERDGGSSKQADSQANTRDRRDETGKSNGSRPKESNNQSESKSDSRADKNRGPRESRSSGSQQSFSPTEVLGNVAQWVWMLIKWVIFLALLGIGGYLAWRYRAELRDAWRRMLAELRSLWARLFGKERPGDSLASEEAVTAQLRRSFSSFQDPFASGKANRWPPEQLVKYTFEAFEAYATEHDCARQSEQTPHEFAQQVGLRLPSLLQPSRTLADLYCQAAYSAQSIPPPAVAALQELWLGMRAVPILAPVST